jgi:GxxExxY protein
MADEPNSEAEPIPPELNRVSGEVAGAAIEVHRHLGPGLLKSIYERALNYELSLRNVAVRRQVPITVMYKELAIDGQRVDLWVDPGVIVELKAVEKILPVHKAQLISYLRSTGCRLGLLINFNHELLTQGVVRMVI